MKHFIAITLIFAVCCGAFWKPQAKAIDPVTIAILAPIAIKGAKIAAPYVMRGLVNGGKGMLTMGEDVLNTMRLPLGAVQSTVLAPFCFSSGVSNLAKGSIAPFKLGLDAVLLPVRFCGVGI